MIFISFAILQKRGHILKGMKRCNIRCESVTLKFMDPCQRGAYVTEEASHTSIEDRQRHNSYIIDKSSSI